MNIQIISAIENSRIIEFQYDGETRIVEPHCYGSTSKNNEVLRAYQIGGFSSTNTMEWKLFSVSKISNIKILENNFTTRQKEGYKQNDKAMSVIYKEL